MMVGREQLRASARPSRSRSRRATASPPASRRTTAPTPCACSSTRAQRSRRSRHARAHVPAAGARGRRPRPRRPDRGDGRPLPARRALSRRRALRDHEGRRHDGAPARPQALCGSGTASRSISVARPDRLPACDTEQLVERVTETRLPTEYGDFRVIALPQHDRPAEHVALVDGRHQRRRAGAGARPRPVRHRRRLRQHALRLRRADAAARCS